MVPLGDEKLYFLSPIGGLSFAMKICMYVGSVAVLPILVFNLYKFIAPAVRKHNARKAIGYASLSMILAAVGVSFAYLVSLPSAIYFLTHFDLGDISAMLTVDAYLSFIVSYVLAGAILFQLPLIMMIVDNITPTPPNVWNKYQRHMVVAALIIAMLITPVPDIINQFILAAPIILMYQFGVFMVWLRHRKLKKAMLLSSPTKKAKKQQATSTELPELEEPKITPHIPVMSLLSDDFGADTSSQLKIETVRTQPRRSIDGVIRSSQATRPTPMAPVTVPQRPVKQAPIAPSRPLRLATTIDGFFPARTSGI